MTHSTHLTQDESATLRSVAAARGESMSEYIAQAIRTRLRRDADFSSPEQQIWQAVATLGTDEVQRRLSVTSGDLNTNIWLT